MLCADRIALAGVDLDHTASSDSSQWNTSRVRRASPASGPPQGPNRGTDLWAPRGQNGAPPTARVDAPPTPP
jgi:hypothetical protein